MADPCICKGVEVLDCKRDCGAAPHRNPTDTEMLDWLEAQANQRGGLLLHDGSESGRRGLGLRPGSVNRTLREAIAQAMTPESINLAHHEDKKGEKEGELG